MFIRLNHVAPMELGHVGLVTSYKHVALPGLVMLTGNATDFYELPPLLRRGKLAFVILSPVVRAFSPTSNSPTAGWRIHSTFAVTHGVETESMAR
jgi:hypothetical protein